VVDATAEEVRKESGWDVSVPPRSRDDAFLYGYALRELEAAVTRPPRLLVTPADLARELGMERDDVIRLAVQAGVPIEHGMIDRARFEEERARFGEESGS
jgi:hypothetical protein